MDARITKQRLSNMLSYDWLKILGAIAAAALVLIMFFTMIATRATTGQTFEIYAYSGVSAGEDFSNLAASLERKKAFSYDILDISTETFTSTKSYGNTVYLARRSAGEGRVLFLSDYHELNDKGEVQPSMFDTVVASGVDEESKTQKQFLNPETFMNDLCAYLVSFFGDDLSDENAAPDEAKTREGFLQRNKKDNRYRSAAQKGKGVQQEKERLVKLKEDYNYVMQAFDDGLLSYADYTLESEAGNTDFRAGIRVGGLPYLSRLVNYQVKDGDKTVTTANEMVLSIFNNKDKEGVLKYDAISFIAYLVRNYTENV